MRNKCISYLILHFLRQEMYLWSWVARKTISPPGLLHCRVSSTKETTGEKQVPKNEHYLRTPYWVFMHREVTTGKERGTEWSWNSLQQNAKKNHSEWQLQQRSGILKTKALKETFPFIAKLFRIREDRKSTRWNYVCSTGFMKGSIKR